MTAESTVVVWAYLGLPMVATVLHAVLGYWIYRNHWDKRGARWFVGTLALGGVYVAVTSIQVLVPWYEVKSFLYLVGGFFGLTSYAAFAVFAGKYTETNYHRNPIVKVALATIPVGYLVIAALQTAGVGWTSELWIETEPFRYLAYEPGPGLMAIVLVSYVLGIYNQYKLIVYLLSTSKRATKQLGLLLAGSGSILIVATVSNLGWFPAEHFYHGVYATIPFIVFTSLALFRFDLLSVQPVARNAVVENLRDPVLVLDEDRRVVDFNDASTRIWPDLDDRVGEPFETACAALADAVDLRGDEDWGRITLPAAGRDRHYSITVSEVTRRGGTGEWLSILLRDVTELERSRWQLEKQNERLDQVASTISHDLRNPINVADGYAEILSGMLDADGMDPDEADTADEYLQEIRTSHSRMESIIDDILTIAREGKTVETTESVSLAEAARDAWGNVDTRDATLTVADDRTLQADRSKLLSILENCFRNAVEHGSTGNRNAKRSGDAVEHGSTSSPSQAQGNAVEHGPADVAVEVGGTDGGFYVEDDGPGIPAEHADDIFEYGYTTTEEGTGLGLSIVRTMAESHGWTVDHDPDYDRGARFVFTEGSRESVAEPPSTVAE